MFDDFFKYIRVVGSMIVVAGLYGFLWGKKMEDIKVNKEKMNQLSKSIDLELQLPNSNDQISSSELAKAKLQI